MCSIVDEDDYVTIGTPFDIPEEDEPLPKATKVADQIVTDKQGRRRLHGAFTGGFSAGYFNTVGSKEGWAPSTFKSSRSMKNNDDEDKEVRKVSKPEDFMDEEDFTEFGIAPKKLKTVSSYSSTDTKLEAQKRSFLRAVDDGQVHSAIPGGIPLDDLLRQRDHSVGIELLKKLGWKPGQGIGEKVELPADKNEDAIPKKKVYGCALPPKSKVECVDMQSFTTMLAPKDIQPIKFHRKDDLHGIGYSGLISFHAIPKGSNINTGKEFRPNSTGKKGIRGQAFGIGVFEEAEEYDVYGDSEFSRHDMTMCDDVDPKDGWTGTTSKPKVYKNCLSGFVKSLKKLHISTTSATLMKIPNVIPRHVFAEELQKDNPKNSSAVSLGCHAQLTSAERSSLLGEVTKTMEDVSHWTLKWDKKENANGNKPAPVLNDYVSTSSDVEKSNFSSRSDKDINETQQKQKSIDRTAGVSKSASSHGNQSNVFKPFSKNPEKQARYELFLSCRNKPDFKYETSTTEWEKAQEIAEFSHAAVLYQPLGSAMSNRFVSAGNKENTDATDESADKKAADMGMFGKLTRTILEWHPDAVLCKRMNIPNPFPNSSMKGVPMRNKKQTSIFSDNFVDNIKTITHPGTRPDAKQNNENEDEDEDEFTSRIQKNKLKTLKSKTGPLSHLNVKLEVPEEGKSLDNLQPPLSSSVGSDNVENEVVKPSIDIFKAIFENSDSEVSDDEEDIKMEENDILMTKNLPDSKSSISIPNPPASEGKSTLKSNVIGQSLVKKDEFDKLEGNKLVNKNNNNIAVNENERNKFLPLAFLNTRGDISKGLTASKTTECKKSGGVKDRPEITSSTTTTITNTRSDEKQDGISQFDAKRKHEKSEHEKTKHKKRKKEKKSKKHKKHKKYDDSDSESDNGCNKEMKKHKSKTEKKYKKKKSKKHGRASSGSSSSDDSHVPSDKLLLEKLKKYAPSSSRPTAADFM